jgi:hypothetical protein
MNRTLGVLLFAAAFASSAAGWATQDVPVTAVLHVAPAVSCPDNTELRRTVEEILARPVFKSGEEGVRVDVAFAPEGGGWEAQIRFFDGDELAGERSLRSEDRSCGSLAGPVGLVVALMLDTHRPRSTLHVPKAPVSEARRVEEEPEARWGMGAMADGRGSVGALPGFALGLSLATELLPPGMIPFRASMTLWPTVDSLDGGVGGRFRLWHAGLEACPGWGQDVRVAICWGLQAGQIEAVGLGLERAREPRHVWVHASAGVDLGFPLVGPLSLHASAVAAVPLHRPNFVYTSRESSLERIHRPEPVVPMVGIGLLANLPP